MSGQEEMEGGEPEYVRGQRNFGHIQKLDSLHQPRRVISAHRGLSAKPDSQCGNMVWKWRERANDPSLLGPNFIRGDID